MKRSKFEKDDDENVKSVEECEKSPANQNTDSVRSKEDAEANNPSENKTASCEFFLFDTITKHSYHSIS